MNIHLVEQSQKQWLFIVVVRSMGRLIIPRLVILVQCKTQFCLPNRSSVECFYFFVCRIRSIPEEKFLFCLLARTPTLFSVRPSCAQECAEVCSSSSSSPNKFNYLFLTFPFFLPTPATCVFGRAAMSHML